MAKADSMEASGGGAQLDKGGQVVSQLIAGKKAIRAVETRRMVNKTLPHRRADITCEAAGREASVDLVSDREQPLRERNARTSPTSRLWLQRNSVAQVSEQNQKAVLLVLLCEVVLGPILGNTSGLRYDVWESWWSYDLHLD